MLTLVAIMMFTSLVTGGMRDSASFLDRSFSDCAFSVSSSSLGLRQPSLKDKKETFACYFTKNNMAISMCYLSDCLRSWLQFSLCLDLGCHEMPWCVIHPIPCLEVFLLLLSSAQSWCSLAAFPHTANIQTRYSSSLTILHLQIDQRLPLLPVRNLGSHCSPAALWAGAILHCPLTGHHCLKTWCYVHSLILPGFIS